MKSLRMLLFAALTLMSFTAFSQEKAGKKNMAPQVKLYTCPMHDSVAMKKPGNCPVCGMKLQLSAKEQMKKDVTKTYSCPMHMDVQSDKPGKCAKCGMSLTLSPKEKMKAEVMKLYSCPMHPDQTCDKPCKCPECGMDMVEKKAEKDSNHQHKQ